MTIQVSKIFAGFLDEIEMAPELARQLRRADDFIRLGVLAGYQVLQPYSEVIGTSGDSCGLVLGTAFGPMETNFEVLEQVVSGEQTSPTLFSHSVFNGAAGYMASILGIKGCALTITDFDFTFFRALEQGYLTLLSGRLELCLVLQIETYSMLLQDAKGEHTPGSKSWTPGVVCWLLEKKDIQDVELFGIKSLHIESKHYHKEKYLQLEEHLTTDNAVTMCTSPLEAACTIGSMMQSAEKKSALDCRIESRYGSVHLALQR